MVYSHISYSSGDGEFVRVIERNEPWGATEFTQDKQLTAAPFNIHYTTPDLSVCATCSGSIKKEQRA